MTEKYMPKVGDKVRATLGESVLVGEVRDAGGDNGNRIRIETAVESYAICDRSDGWQFEQVVSVPSKFGAVIRRADGEMFVLTSPGRDIDASCWLTNSGERWADVGRATRGGFSIEFDGVDE